MSEGTDGIEQSEQTQEVKLSPEELKENAQTLLGSYLNHETVKSAKFQETVDSTNKDRVIKRSTLYGGTGLDRDQKITIVEIKGQPVQVTHETSAGGVMPSRKEIHITSDPDGKNSIQAFDFGPGGSYRGSRYIEPRIEKQGIDSNIAVGMAENMLAKIPQPVKVAAPVAA
ncbi:hypothetical protein A3C59_04425 [Candidatus Daviesbacteria bacterium RIFCSPHIGHO2_02_FULL_36_13]|uniref:Uncharacterized protein n=1 Tax=Candidatus Daviesbacteria bacterium RIFCSPHIGHO2_02_FULL_36_13 TaxID=1797768 RepID=A0A1F5JWB1_9BACT|nr:MAG: hypothetical protein A3C59_04425 [Candidatus Daviesbacteria bacterium RIFCSPHIGHO2_02_FULL_36_13]